MRRFVLPGALVLSVFVVVWAAGTGSFPLGVPEQWEWNRVAPSEPLRLALVPVLIAAGLYLGFTWLGGKYVPHSRPLGLAAWLGGLALAGFAWLWVAQESAPQNFQLSKAAWILYYRGSSGYFSEAHDRAGDLPRYLAGYEAKLKEGDVLHIGTHPPGLIVALRGLMALCQASPWLVDLVQATESASARDAFDELKLRDPLAPADRATLWLAALLVQALAALTVVPLFGLLRTSCGRRASWRAAVFWPAVPALAVFLPKSDCLFPFLATTFVWLWLRGLDRKSPWCCALAGLVFWIGLSLSLAFLPVGVLGLLAGWWNLHFARGSASAETLPAGEVATDPSPAAHMPIRTTLSRLLPATAWAFLGWSIPVLLVWSFTGLNLLHVWWLNFRNHSGFYDRYPRTYWKWLLVNPLEFAAAAGLPLVLLATWSLIRLLRRRAPVGGLAWAFLITLGLLWISGKNMGEAARLWIFLMPFLVWILGPLFESPGRPTAGAASPAPGIAAGTQQQGAASSVWGVGLAAQLVATAFIVTQVAGFHPPEPVPKAPIVSPP